MRTTPLHLAAIGTALLFSRALTAHHSFAADFDAARPVRLTGTLTRLEWTNPHAHIVLDTATSGGSVASWRVELSTPNVLTRAGWLKNTVKAGDRLTVNGYAAKDGSRFVTARSVELAGGRTLFTRAAAARN